MGYSARYHIASLTAVFFALAIGILIGSQYGGDLLSSTRQDLEKSLTHDLDSTRAEVKELNRREAWATDFGAIAFPLLVDGRLAGQRIGLIGLGDLPPEVTDAVEQAIEPTGAQLVAVGAVRNPPDLESIAGSLTGTRFATIDRRPRRLAGFGRAFGRQAVVGGPVLEKARQATLSQSSGQFGQLDGLVAYRPDPAGLSAEEAELSSHLNQAVLKGAIGSGARVVGVETRGTEPSGIGYFRDHSLSTVDNLDMPSGKLSLVYALDGTEGSFGVKEDATRLVPELLRPVPETRARGRQLPGKRG